MKTIGNLKLSYQYTFGGMPLTLTHLGALFLFIDLADA